MQKKKRNIKQARKIIWVFCEGESEQEYARFLKEEYSDVVAIQTPVLGTFDQADRNFKNDLRYKSSVNATDEIWFFFDTEEDTAVPWEKNKKVIDGLKKLRKKQGINVRLLMNKACIEYWFLLHYEKTDMPIRSAVDKSLVENKLKSKIGTYKKGDHNSIFKIAENHLTAKENGAWSLKRIEELGLPNKKEVDFRNKWLYETGYTFTTVHEAIEYLEYLRLQAKQNQE